MPLTESSRKFPYTVVVYVLVILIPRNSEANTISFTIPVDTSKKAAACLYDR